MSEAATEKRDENRIFFEGVGENSRPNSLTDSDGSLSGILNNLQSSESGDDDEDPFFECRDVENQNDHDVVDFGSPRESALQCFNFKIDARSPTGKSDCDFNFACEEKSNAEIDAGCVSDDQVDASETASDQIKAAAVTRRHSFDGAGDIIQQFLDKSNAEARLLARRQARAEAREIRMRELERQQREQEENADRQFDMLAEPLARASRGSGTCSRFLSSRRSSEDSLEDSGSLRELRNELKEVEEKFRKAMIANAQLDNDKAAQTYQLELLKDRLEELEEEHSQLKREHRDKCREHDQIKRLAARLKDELAVTRAELEERDRLIAEKGLVIVGEDVPPEEHNGLDSSLNSIGTPKKALVSAENAHLLENSGEGSLDVRLARFARERSELQDQISHLHLELEEERSKRRKSSNTGVTLNGPTLDSDLDAADLQREASKQLAEYKFRAQKAEQDVATLQATVARLESQVIRYKSAAEISEKSEEALKAEKRKLLREAREAQSRAEELETSNSHLLKRLDKLKNAKSALLKEL